MACLCCAATRGPRHMTRQRGRCRHGRGGRGACGLAGSIEHYSLPPKKRSEEKSKAHHIELNVGRSYGRLLLRNCTSQKAKGRLLSGDERKESRQTNSTGSKTSFTNWSEPKVFTANVTEFAPAALHREECPRLCFRRATPDGRPDPQSDAGGRERRPRG